MRDDRQGETQSHSAAEIAARASLRSASEREQLLAEFSRHRPRLLSIAYRMLGSASEAEDIVQEAFIRWQQNWGPEIDSAEAFLVTIVSRLCINYLQSARMKREEYFGQWLPEPVATGQDGDPYSLSQRDESLSMAFLVLLERLTPMERAVFLMHEVFEYEYAELAQMLEQSESNCRQVLRRARQHLKEARPRFEPSSRQHQELFRGFLQASAGGDVEGLLALFSRDIVVYADGGGKSRAVPKPVFGADNAIRFMFGARKKFLPKDLVIRVVEINGASGLVTYHEGRPYSALSFEIGDGRIRGIYIVSNPDKLGALPQLSAGSC